MQYMYTQFPKDFLFGFSMSSFQFEMGIPGSEDTASDWWVWTHSHENITAELVSGDLPENGPGYWNLYSIDHTIADRLGMNAARLCVEWSRIFPKPTTEVKVDYEIRDNAVVHVDVREVHLKKLDELANKAAVEHYREIFCDWKKRGKILILNLYHWPLPLWLHDPLRARASGLKEGPLGWLEKRTVIEFVKYVAYVVWKFDDLVDMWSTMNEPNALYMMGYVFVKRGFPPGVLSLDAARKAMLNLIDAHARAYDVIKELSKKPVGIIYAFTWVEPLKEEDKEAAESAKLDYMYRFIDAITKGYIDGVRRDDLRNHLDWLGVNYYTRLVVTRSKDLLLWRPVKNYGFHCNPNSLSIDGRPASDFGWEVYPEGLKYLLLELKHRYGVPMIVTENGIADKLDILRPRYIVSHLAQVIEAIKKGADVRGYLHWSLIDNYEWAQGFKMRFGLCYVDYETKKRYLRPSALVFREIATSKSIPEDFEYMKEPIKLREFRIDVD